MGALAGLAASSASPRVEASGPGELHADFEVDPTAYVLDGHSLHVGLGWGRLRLDLGAYAMSLPDAISGNDRFSVSFDGYGAKLQYFPFTEQQGAFVGVDGGLTRPSVRRKGTDLARDDRAVGIGVNAGYRWSFSERFYATAWVGLGYMFGAEEVELDGAKYEPNPITIFPAIHLGYRFR